METLAERIARDGPVSELDAIGWAIRLAKRLEALHALGVAHGSVSPACILTAGQDRNARAYLADVQHTSSSPAYQSPERIVGGDISVADDVWALAATLYALLTGQSPFAGATDAEVRQKIAAASPAPLAVYDVGDDDVQHILDHAFARELGGRLASVAAFRRALEEWHPDRGVANLPPLEDEDPTDEDDGARTMLVRDGLPMTKGGGGALPKVNEDDDDDNVRTVMREMPRDSLAALVAAAAARKAAATGRPPPTAPVSGFEPTLLSPPEGAPGGPAPRVAAQPFPMAAQEPPKAGPPRPVIPALRAVVPAPRAAVPAPAPRAVVPAPAAAAPAPQPAPEPAAPAPAQHGLPQLVDEETEDNIRTMLVTPEQMAASKATAGGQEPAAPPPQDGPVPAPTVALPAHLDPSAAGFAGDAPLDPAFAGPKGTQKISSSDLPPGMAGAAGAPAAPPGPAEPALAAPAAPAPAAPMPQPLAIPPEPAGTSKKGLVLAALLALLLAAAATFAFLKLRGL